MSFESVGKTGFKKKGTCLESQMRDFLQRINTCENKRVVRSLKNRYDLLIKEDSYCPYMNILHFLWEYRFHFFANHRTFVSS